MTPSKPLTASEIAALPDRALDALVATRVMGLFVIGRDWLCEKFAKDFRVSASRDGDGPCWRLPDYSTDPRAMMEVVDRMRALRYEGMIEWAMDDSQQPSLVAHFTHENETWGHHVAARTIPRAVAEAALLAVMSGENTNAEG